MSAESQTLQQDYIRLTERFKALSTFDQFLQGIHRAFLPARTGHALDLNSLYDELKLLSSKGGLADGSTAPPLAELEAKFEAAAGELRAADISLSPSLTRRYFEKVLPSDPRIPFYLLRFYGSFSQTDEDLLDKVDYLATVLAAGSPDPAAAPSRSPSEIRKLFDAVLTDTGWPRVDDDTASEIARAFDEIAAQIAAASGFGNLAEEGWIESLRNFKRQVGRGLAHPEILTSAALCNLTARAAFHRLYEREERTLRGAARRIGGMGHQPSGGDREDSAALRLFEESRREFERQVAEGSVRWRQLLEVRQAASEALKLLGVPEAETGEKTRGGEEAALGGLDDPFWGPCLRRILSTLGDGGEVSVEGLRSLAEWSLETWETDAARRLMGGQHLSREDHAVLSAAALRIKAEGETDAAGKSSNAGVPADLLQQARETLARASELDHVFSEFVGGNQSDDESAEHVRCWTRTRMRLLHATSALWLALDGS
jgi:hypothetical protein